MSPEEEKAVRMREDGKEIAQRVVQLTKERNPDKRITAIVIGDDNMGNYLKLALDETTLSLAKEIQPGVTLLGCLNVENPGGRWHEEDKLHLILDSQMRHYNMAIVGWWNIEAPPDKWPYSFKAYTGIHLLETSPD
ncbi:MAG: hypothetical protein A3J76_04440 [Candidatus Moranbacteria bacterium RBG_13_45_13]|nr:MAG: hypothetical protein A3J76_04440 [Candidatus Moranbacteria bacterium RBG_13_45_13]